MTQAAMLAFSHSTWLFIVSLVAAAWLRLSRHTQRLRDAYVRSLAGETQTCSVRHLSAALSLRVPLVCSFCSTRTVEATQNEVLKEVADVMLMQSQAARS